MNKYGKQELYNDTDGNDEIIYMAGGDVQLHRRVSTMARTRMMTRLSVSKHSTWTMRLTTTQWTGVARSEPSRYLT
eukprot:5289590-Pyramimonas_sp.AAC.2